MFIKQFRTVQVRVPDPLRPGKRAFEDRLIATGCGSLSHGGQTYTADEDGWFEVDYETGNKLRSFRHPTGERFYLPEEVDEQVRLGAIEDVESATPARLKSKPVLAR